MHVCTWVKSLCNEHSYTHVYTCLQACPYRCPYMSLYTSIHTCPYKLPYTCLYAPTHYACLHTRPYAYLVCECGVGWVEWLPDADACADRARARLIEMRRCRDVRVDMHVGMCVDMAYRHVFWGIDISHGQARHVKGRCSCSRVRRGSLSAGIHGRRLSAGIHGHRSRLGITVTM